MGPVEYLIVEFPGNKLKGEIIPALANLTKNGTIRIIDLAFIRKEADGSFTSFELSELGDGERRAFNDLDAEVNDLLNRQDINLAAEALSPDSSAAMMVFENVWATRLRDTIVNANGRLVENRRIPAEVVEEALRHAGSDTETREAA